MGSLSLAVVHVTEMPLYYTVAIIGTALRWFLLNVHGNHCVAHEELPTCFRWSCWEKMDFESISLVLTRSIATILTTEIFAMSPTITRELWFASLIDGIEKLLVDNAEWLLVINHHQISSLGVLMTLNTLRSMWPSPHLTTQWHPWDYLDALFLLIHNSLLATVLSPIFEQLSPLLR